MKKITNHARPFDVPLPLVEGERVVAPSFSFGHFLRTRWARMEASNSGADADSQTGGGLMDTNLGRSQQRWCGAGAAPQI